MSDAEVKKEVETTGDTIGEDAVQEDVEKLNKEELEAVQAVKQRMLRAREVKQRAEDALRTAELEHRVIVQQIFIRRGLTVRDSFHDETGVITRGALPEGGGDIIDQAAAAKAEAATAKAKGND